MCWKINSLIISCEIFPHFGFSTLLIRSKCNIMHLPQYFLHFMNILCTKNYFMQDSNRFVFGFVFLYLQTCQINWGSPKSGLWWSKWWATRTTYPGPSAEEVRKGAHVSACVCARERKGACLLSTVVLFNGPYLLFDLSSGSKGQGHLPLSAQSVWQGQEPF